MLYNKDWDNLQKNPLSRSLLGAAEQIEKHGHAKHILKDANGSMCFLGALEEVGCFVGTELNRSAAVAVCKVVGLKHTRYDDFTSRGAVGKVVAWNNEDERTAQEVIDAMRAA